VTIPIITSRQAADFEATTVTGGNHWLDVSRFHRRPLFQRLRANLPFSLWVECIIDAFALGHLMGKNSSFIRGTNRKPNNIDIDTSVIRP
jgi:hypothetical protein